MMTPSVDTREAMLSVGIKPAGMMFAKTEAKTELGSDTWESTLLAELKGSEITGLRRAMLELPWGKGRTGGRLNPIDGSPPSSPPP